MAADSQEAGSSANCTASCVPPTVQVFFLPVATDMRIECSRPSRRASDCSMTATNRHEGASPAPSRRIHQARDGQQTAPSREGRSLPSNGRSARPGIQWTSAHLEFRRRKRTKRSKKKVKLTRATAWHNQASRQHHTWTKSAVPHGAQSRRHAGAGCRNSSR
jgi:hypothetical protein